MTDREQIRRDAKQIIAKRDDYHLRSTVRLARGSLVLLAELEQAERASESYEARIKELEERLVERGRWWAQKHEDEQRAAMRMVEQAERERDERDEWIAQAKMDCEALVEALRSVLGYGFERDDELAPAREALAKWERANG